MGYEKHKARARALEEHPFHVVKDFLKHREVKYRGLTKNLAQLHSIFALANFFIARTRLCPAQ